MSLLVSRTRFGLLGPPASAPGPDSPDGVIAQIRQPIALPQGDRLPDRDEAIRLFASRRVEMNDARRESRQARREVFTAPHEVLIAEADARLALATATRTPFQERLALHWLNHFTVIGQLAVGYLAGDMERTAIRPNMLGKFSVLLRACTTHPAMLAFLSNDRSFGPNSPEGRRLQRGLNENHARELLELHTLGVNGGYTQADVLETARILTGWSLPTARSGAGSLVFVPDKHEPGARVVLGKRYPEAGAEQLLSLLDDLARHPSTARHVTRRMVRHFLGDTASPQIADSLARVFRDTDGDLRAVTEAMVRHPESWSLPLRKLRPPIEMVFCVSRILGGLPSGRPVQISLRALGQPWLRATSPAGWPEEDNAWASPDAVKSRLDWALQMVERRDARADARQLADASFGPALSAETRRTLQRAANGGQALALLAMSPEVQRR